MIRWYPWLLFLLSFSSGHALAAVELGTVTLVEGVSRVLRGATWYKVAAGLRVEEGDIVVGDDRTQLQIEFAGGSIVNLAGGTVYFAPPVKSALPVLALQAGWMKVVAKIPGLRVRTPLFDATAVDAILVVRAQANSADLFIEAGSAQLTDAQAAGPDAVAREAKRGEYWARPVSGTFLTVTRAPRPFVDAMPRHFIDPVPVLAARIKSKPALVVDHEITFAEAEPWLAGRDRAAFERRFAVRLRDPAFRKAVEPTVARYPSWDRQLHPEKFAPKVPPPVPAVPPPKASPAK